MVSKRAALILRWSLLSLIVGIFLYTLVRVIVEAVMGEELVDPLGFFFNLGYLLLAFGAVWSFSDEQLVVFTWFIFGVILVAGIPAIALLQAIFPAYENTFRLNTPLIWLICIIIGGLMIRKGYHLHKQFSLSKKKE